jgi:hypothetical protein
MRPEGLGQFEIDLVLKMILKVRREGVGVIDLPLYTTEWRVPVSTRVKLRCL